MGQGSRGEALQPAPGEQAGDSKQGQDSQGTVYGARVNASSFNQLRDMGIYLVNNHFDFTTKYLEVSMLRLLLGNLPPGQEASIRTLLSEDDPRAITSTNFQLYQRALEGYALAQRLPDAVVHFSLYRPSEHLALTKEPFLFPTPVPVKVLSFDGHFGYIDGSTHSMRYEEQGPCQGRAGPCRGT